ncbi:hypothetical protein LCGC14_0773830 [marine sediment metagenome]|uniref:Uncharacterized protein n=1 Tax=marine sediment metagenome TaxID=412755 RepID=A0A0F9SHH3_9ZZZZ|nr:DUF99 family protein [bacterium]
MKEHPITIGFDDAAFNLKSKAKNTHLIGVVCQGIRMVNIVRASIKIDGNDATEKLIDLVKQNEEHIQYILTHTITFGGFNLINLNRIYNELKKPIIAVNDREVNIEAVEKALRKNFPKFYTKKLQQIFDSGNLYKTEIKTAGGISNIYFHSKGIEIKEVELLLQKICIDSKLPESIRLAHLIGRVI